MGLRGFLPLAVLALCLLAGPGRALDLSLPGKASLTREVTSPADTYFLPVGPYADGAIDVLEVEGRVTQQAWRVEGAGLTTLQLLRPLREQLVEAGYDILFDCAAPECGGFDFRFNTSVLPAPDMFVDLFDFRFLSARKQGGDTVDYITLLVSLSGEAGYVQLVSVGTNAAPSLETAATDEPRPSAAGAGKSGLIDRLRAEGHVVLPDLVFDSGAAALAEGSYASLAALAGFLKADDSRRVALVGHTDAVGGLEPNVALSRERAASVLERLATRHEVPREQMESNGMGYLSPVAPNTSAEGREANRRVEAVLLDTE